MKAVVMAGGEGTRLRPLTCNRPKPMVPVAGKPVMEHIISLLKNHGIYDIAVTLQYLPDIISGHFEDGGQYGVRMRYYIENKPLGTAGSVKNAESYLDDTFLVISGDALTDIDISKAVRFHKDREAMATLVLKRVDIPLEYGVVVTGDDGRIVRFLEKPGWGEVISDTVNTGIYILSPEIFEYLRPNEFFDFSRDLFPILLNENKRMYGFVTDDYWCDIGDINAYIQANFDVIDRRVKAEITGKEIKEGIWIGKETSIDDNVSLEAPCMIGSGCHIRGGSVIGKYSIIGDNTTVADRCSIKRSVIWKNTVIGGSAQLRGSIICSRAYLEPGVSAFENSVIGENSKVGERAVIRPDIKIWPGKSVGQGMEVESNIVWGSRARRQLFGNRGVTGTVNIDMTPEFAAKLGASFGSVIKSRGSIGVGCDGSTSAAMIKNALISGLMSSGVHVNDYDVLLLPSMRSAVRFYRLDGGIYAGSLNSGSRRLALDFIDKTGSSIDRGLEKKVENVFSRDDFARCEGDCLKGITEIKGFQDFYIKNVINQMKSGRLDFKILLNDTSSLGTRVVMDLLTELGCRVEAVTVGNDRPEGLSDMGQFCRYVKTGGFDLGVSIEDSCEKMLLVDSTGKLLTEDIFIALISMILFRKLSGSTVVVPVSASQAIERIADEYNGNVVRTKTSARDIMGRLLGRDAKEELLEQFSMNFDAVAGLVKLLDYLNVNGSSLSDMVSALPEIHMRTKEVECSWDKKGKVVRKIIQEHSGSRIDTLEGVKVYNEKGWVLVLPDSEKPLCRVIGEGASEEFAEELTNIYVRKVREISRG
jgi:mannose-1-phosphate guanylyltransferase/phosphomannomutase